MKGLSYIPSSKKLASVYYNLQFAQKKESDKSIALYSQWVRLDPRLGEILVAYIAKFWKSHHPISLNEEIKKQVWPQALGVILEQTKLYFFKQSKSSQSSKKKLKEKLYEMKEDLALFQSWYECVMCSIKPASGELFFFEIYSIGSSLFHKEVFHTTKSYRKWGYLGKELMLNKTISLGKTLIPSEQRKCILENLIQKKKTITVKEYLSELDFQVHPKQAQMDLKNHKKLKPRGYTRSRVYLVKK